MRAIDPSAHFGILGIRYQERKTEVVQHALDSALPFPGIFANLDELAGKWHCILFESQCGTHCDSHHHLFLRNVAASGLETRNLPGESVVLILTVAQGHAP